MSVTYVLYIFFLILFQGMATFLLVVFPRESSASSAVFIFELVVTLMLLGLLIAKIIRVTRNKGVNMIMVVVFIISSIFSFIAGLITASPLYITLTVIQLVACGFYWLRIRRLPY